MPQQSSPRRSILGEIFRAIWVRPLAPLSLWAKLLVGIALIALPSLVLAIIGNVNLLNQRRSEIFNTDRAFTSIVGDIVDDAINEAIGVGSAVATEAAAPGATPGSMTAFLRRLGPNYPQFSDIVIVNAAGDIIAQESSPQPGSAGLPPAAATAATQAIARGLPEVSLVEIDPRTGRRATFVAVPVRATTGAPTGAVVVSLDLDSLQADLRHVPLTNGRVALVTDPSGRLAVASEPISQVERDVSGVELIHEAQTTGEGTADAAVIPGLPGVWLGTSLRTTAYQWIVAVVQPTGLATSAVSQQLRVTIASFLLLIILGAIGALYLSGQILSPLNAIRTASQHWRAGDLSARIESGPTVAGEIGHLIDTLNAMAGSLDEKQHALQVTEQRLLAESTRLRAIVNTSPAGILVMAPDERIVLENPAAEALLGESLLLKPEAASHAAASRLFHPDGQPFRFEDVPVVRALRTGATVAGVEVVLRRSNGSERHLLVNAAPILSPGGQIEGAVAVFFDISPLAEEERLRKEFVQTAAHEFRNPLTVIKGYAEVAMKNGAIQGTSVGQDLERIVDAADRVTRLADDLLRSAQLHLPPVVLRAAVINLADLAKSAIDQQQSSDPSHTYHLKIESQKAMVEGDPALLREAVDDLLRQAAQVTPSGGIVGACVSAWDGICTIAVTDHGPSVAPEEIPNLFLPFAAPSAAQIQEMQRPALLLYSAKRIIEESGGWIRAQSSPQVTTISFTLPRYNPERTGPPVPTSASPLATPALGPAVNGRVSAPPQRTDQPREGAV